MDVNEVHLDNEDKELYQEHGSQHTTILWTVQHVSPVKEALSPLASYYPPQTLERTELEITVEKL